MRIVKGKITWLKAILLKFRVVHVIFDVKYALSLLENMNNKP